MTGRRLALAAARDELAADLREGILPFWLQRAVDSDAGGYHTALDGEGRPVRTDGDRFLVTQARLVWCFASFAHVAEDPGHALSAARHGVDYLVGHFLDESFGGWRWRVSRRGDPLDEVKLTYGQCFALFALAAFARATGEARALELAVSTFETLRRRAADPVRGGYLENLTRDWRPAHRGSAGGDRKSLDVHMHLLEAFTELLRVTGERAHRDALTEVREVLRRHMVDQDTGSGGMQYDLDLQPLAPITIDRTWVAERPGARASAATSGLRTCYGHNLELAWLLREADEVLGEPGASDATVAALGGHALAYGHDRRHGGVYREGPPVGPASDTDKEFWQNAEALVGFLELHRVTSDAAYLGAFLDTWAFAKAHLVHPQHREWRVRTTRNGEMVADALGNAWKVGYHTGRAALESVRRLELVLQTPSAAMV